MHTAEKNPCLLGRSVYPKICRSRSGNKLERGKPEEKDKIEKDMAALADRIEKAKVGKPSPYIRFMFNMMAMAKKNPDDPESEHWKKQGWLDGKRPWKD